MTRITTGCPQCGKVELDIGEVTLVVSPAQDRSWYLFDCLNCAQQVVKSAPTTVAVALTSVHVRIWTVPAEVTERTAAPPGPAVDGVPGRVLPLGVDDLLDALLTLRRHRHLADLADRLRAADPVDPRPAHPNAA